jgi:hypothetical protein
LKEAVMRIPLVAFIGFAVMSSFCILHVAAADDKTFQGPDPATEKVIRDSLHRLAKAFGRRGFGFQDAQSSKEELSKLRGLGFDSVDQLTNLTIGQGFPLYVVRLDMLKSYDKETDPWSLLARTDASIYPLIVLQKKDLEVRSSVTVSLQQEPRDGTKIPHVAEIGNPELIRLLTEARTELQKGGGCHLPSECFVVSIPALSLHLLGYRNEGITVFILVRLNDVRGQVKKEDFLPAEDVLGKLSSDANTKMYDRPFHTPNKHKQLPPANLNPRRENAIN